MQTLKEIVENNINQAIDQAAEYQNPRDSFSQNVFDTCIELGYSRNEAVHAFDMFLNLWISKFGDVAKPE